MLQLTVLESQSTAPLLLLNAVQILVSLLTLMDNVSLVQAQVGIFIYKYSGYVCTYNYVVYYLIALIAGKW